MNNKYMFFPQTDAEFSWGIAPLCLTFISLLTLESSIHNISMGLSILVAIDTLLGGPLRLYLTKQIKNLHNKVKNGIKSKRNKPSKRV